LKIKQFNQGITFFVTQTMYNDLKNISDKKKVALSELLREMIAKYLEVEKAIQQEN
jgi:rRNA-processing protein FCF1